jgi:voltage-gated potassium channel Kch
MIKTIHNYTDSIGEICAYFAGLILLGGAAFSYIEGETLFRSIYWATITATSVGYGDISPKTTPGMALAMAVAVFGLILMALLIAKVHSVLIRNDHEFTDEEQRLILEKLTKIEENLK